MDDKGIKTAQKDTYSTAEKNRRSSEGLSTVPDCKNVKALAKHHYQYRLRIGRYRIFFNIEDSLKIARIEEVKKRDERTY